MQLFQVIAASCLEIWAMRQPGGDTLHLRIKVGSKTGGEKQSLCPGGGGGAALWEAGGAPLWKAGAWAGAWAVQGHQAHLQRSKHNPGKINFHFLFALEIKELTLGLSQLKLYTQVIFHARKKLQLQGLKELAAARTADQLLNLSAAKQLAAEGLIPADLVQDLTLACLDTWTQRLRNTSR